MKRRDLIKAALFVAPALGGRKTVPAPLSITARLQALEQAHGGRLGVAAMDTAQGQTLGYRLNERFLMCSTFKLMLAAAVLARVDQGRESLAQRIIVRRGDLLEYAPVTRMHIGPPGMTLAELCRAAVTVSDNTAANLLLGRLGGPSRWTAFMRGLGDRVSLLERYEPELNRATPGSPRGTTMPSATVAVMQRLLLGDALAADSRRLLLGWLRDSTTGKTKLRAGLPSGWVVGDKTGGGFRGETNDVAIAWPPGGRPPWLVAAYYEPPRADGRLGPPVLAAVGRIIASS